MPSVSPQVLGQLPAFDVAPTSRLIVPLGHVNYFGVDPGTMRVAIATVDAEGRRGVSMVSIPSMAGGERMAAIFRETRRLTCELAAMLPPGVVVVEQPSGSQPNPSLSYAVGVVMAAVFEGVRHSTGKSVRVLTVPSSKWKAVACGNGRIWKPKKGSGEEYGVLKWARMNGYSGSSFDECDAMGVCEFARKTFRLDAR